MHWKVIIPRQSLAFDAPSTSVVKAPGHTLPDDITIVLQKSTCIGYILILVFKHGLVTGV
jgi:hypothetical protein